MCACSTEEKKKKKRTKGKIKDLETMSSTYAEQREGRGQLPIWNQLVPGKGIGSRPAKMCGEEKGLVQHSHTANEGLRTEKGHCQTGRYLHGNSVHPSKKGGG